MFTPSDLCLIDIIFEANWNDKKMETLFSQTDKWGRGQGGGGVWSWPTYHFKDPWVL